MTRIEGYDLLATFRIPTHTITQRNYTSSRSFVILKRSSAPERVDETKKELPRGQRRVRPALAPQVSLGALAVMDDVNLQKIISYERELVCGESGEAKVPFVQAAFLKPGGGDHNSALIGSLPDIHTIDWGFDPQRDDQVQPQHVLVNAKYEDNVFFTAMKHAKVELTYRPSS